MNYIPSSRSRLYRLIAPLSSLYRYLVLILIVGITSLVWFYMCYQPIEKYIACYAKRIDDLNGQSSRYKEQSCKNIQLQDSINTMQQAVNNTPATLLQCPITILEHALKAGLSPITYTQDPPKEISWAYTTVLHMVFAGTLEQVHAFLTILAHQESLLVQCSHLELAHKQTRIFACSCILNIYTRKPICS